MWKPVYDTVPSVNCKSVQTMIVNNIEYHVIPSIRSSILRLVQVIKLRMDIKNDNIS